MSEASWQADPTGRHQYRWFDGTNWTDNVSDNGQTGSDPYEGGSAPATVFGGGPAGASPAPAASSAPVWQTPAAPGPASAPAAAPAWQTPAASGPPAAPAWEVPAAPSSAPVFGGPAASPSAPGGAPAYLGGGAPPFGGLPSGEATAKRSNPLKWILPIVGVVALGVVAFIVLGGGGGDDKSSAFGISERSLAEDDTVDFITLNLKRGDSIRVRVEGSEDLDPLTALLTSEEIAEEDFDLAVDVGIFAEDVDFDDVYVQANDTFTDGDLGDERRSRVVVSSDLTSDGGFETLNFIVFVDGTYRVAVGSALAESSGDYRLIIERNPEALDEDVLTDLEEFTDALEEDFFSDRSFYEDDDPYEPDN